MVNLQTRLVEAVVRRLSLATADCNPHRLSTNNTYRLSGTRNCTRAMAIVRALHMCTDWLTPLCTSDEGDAASITRKDLYESVDMQTAQHGPIVRV